MVPLFHPVAPIHPVNLRLRVQVCGWWGWWCSCGWPWRWLGVNQMNCAISVIAYQTGLPASLLTFNDAAHLSPELRWTGFPPALRF